MGGLSLSTGGFGKQGRGILLVRLRGRRDRSRSRPEVLTLVHGVVRIRIHLGCWIVHFGVHGHCVVHRVGVAHHRISVADDVVSVLLLLLLLRWEALLWELLLLWVWSVLLLLVWGLAVVIHVVLWDRRGVVVRSPYIVVSRQRKAMVVPVKGRSVVAH